MVMTDFLVGEERVIIFLSATLVSILSRNLLSLFAEVIQNLITSSPLPYHSLLMCGFQLQSPNRSCVFLVIPPSHMVCSQQSKNDAFITQVRLLFLCSKSCSISHFTERRGPYASLKGLGHQLLSSSFLLLILQPHRPPFPFHRPHTPRPQNLGICPVMRTIFTQKSALFLLKCYILLWGLP